MLMVSVKVVVTVMVVVLAVAAVVRCCGGSDERIRGNGKGIGQRKNMTRM